MDSQDIAPILWASDDVLELIVQAAVQDTDGRYDHKGTVILSQVCSRLRRLILLRAAFWNDLKVNSATSSDAVEAVLHRSQSLLLHIDIDGTGQFKRLRDSGATLATLFQAVAQCFPQAESLSVSGMQELDSEMLSHACETVNRIRGDVRLRTLSVSYSRFKDPTLNMVVGSHLAVLNLIYLKEPLASLLSKIFHLAPNIEVLRVAELLSDAHSQGSDIDEPPAHGSRLQFVQIDSADRDGDFARAVELVQRYSPQAILDGRVVELRDSDEVNCIAKMELERFKEVHSIIYSSNESTFTITYPAWTLPTRRPVGAHTLAEQMRQLGEIGLVIRGFNADLSDLLEPRASPARKILRHSITMTRSLILRTVSVSDAFNLFTILAHDSWPMLEHISLELYIDFGQSLILPWETWKPIDVPQLRTINIKLESLRCETPKYPSEEVIQSWAIPCVALVNALSSPTMTKFVVRSASADEDPDATASVLGAIRQAFSSDRLTDSLVDATS